MTDKPVEWPRRSWRNLFAPGSVCLIWLGVIAGLAFIAAPARFGAAETTFPIALDIGREVFAMLQRVEFGFLAAVFLSGWLSRSTRYLWCLLFAIAAILALQSLWLMPELMARSLTITGGGQVAASPVHGVYMVLELAKMLCLLTVGMLCRSGAGAGP